MKIHGFFPSEQEMTVMIEKVDKNRNGRIDFEEFVSMMLNITESSADQGYNVSQAFQVFDKVKLVIINFLAFPSDLTIELSSVREPSSDTDHETRRGGRDILRGLMCRDGGWEKPGWNISTKS